MYKRYDPQHDQLRNTLRTIGPIVLVVGVIFAVIGIGNFFMSFGSFEPPRYFWCAFIGLPLVGLGVALTKFAYLGAITRYMANEVAPVGKDVTNYMAHGTKDAMREVAGAIGEGLRGETKVVRCGGCQTENEPGANFCKNCGHAIGERSCPKCFEPNDVDAKFCNHCGQQVAEA